jgi:putative peptidoglycan lipid II flippase
VSSLFRSNIVVAAGTALSRVTGLLRVSVFAYVIGQEALGDAYKLGNETPNIVYDLLLGGVLSATLIPLFTSYMGDDDKPTDQRATNVIITTAATLMVALTLVAVAAAPLVFRLYSLDVSDDVDPELFRDVGTSLTRIFLVQILFYGLTGLANAYLQSRRRFFAAAWTPVAANVVIVASLLSLPDAGGRTWTLQDVIDNDRLRWTLALGATLGIATMALLVIPAALRAGLNFRPVWDWKHPAVRKLLVMSGWTIGFVAANQVAVMVIRNLAIAEGAGIAAAYFDAFVLFVLPHGLLAVSISTTFQPELARAVVARDRAAFVDRTSLGVRLIAMLTLPAGAAMFVLREPIVGGLLQYGRFSEVAAANTSDALAGFALGLVGFSVYMFTLRGFYAHHDTRTAFVVNVVENAINIALAFVLVGRFGVLGLAVSYAIAYLGTAWWALRILSSKVREFPLRPIATSVARSLGAAALMAGALWAITRNVEADSGWRAIVQLVVAGVVGLVVYAAALIASRAPELASLRLARRRDAGSVDHAG